MQFHSENSKDTDWLDFAVFTAAVWIAGTLILSFFRIHWLIPGDFKYATAMYYHGVMVPVLVLLYLLTIKILPLKIPNKRIYVTAAISSILLVSLGSIFNLKKGLTVASVTQIAGMATADFLGIVLTVAMILFALNQGKKIKELGVAFWLLFSSMVAILVAAPIGHISGWGIDFGISSFPGMTALLHVNGVKPRSFQDALVSSHSHLIVFAVLCGLVALTAIHFQYQSLTGWRKRVSNLGLWMALVSILSVMLIYVVSVLFGWEPPTFFISGPGSVNGIPVDDLVLTLGEAGFLTLIIGLTEVPVQMGRKWIASLRTKTWAAISLNWILGFVGTVVLGIYIELNEAFYGGGRPPAPGAINDQVFTRAHLLYAFFLLPITFSILLAVECRYNQATALRLWPSVFVYTSILGMVLGLIGEFLWVDFLDKGLLFAGLVLMNLAILMGAATLWPATKSDT